MRLREALRHAASGDVATEGGFDLSDFALSEDDRSELAAAMARGLDDRDAALVAGSMVCEVENDVCLVDELADETATLDDHASGDHDFGWGHDAHGHQADQADQAGLLDPATNGDSVVADPMDPDDDPEGFDLTGLDHHQIHELNQPDPWDPHEDHRPGLDVHSELDVDSGSEADLD